MLTLKMRLLFHHGNGIAYVDNIDADNYDSEADAVYID
jgi:hypothetical protein